MKRKIYKLIPGAKKVLFAFALLMSVTAYAQTTYTFAYTGAVQNMVLSGGNYKVEMWGADGGDNMAPLTGGKGGYSTGTITATPGMHYFYVGGKGITGIGGAGAAPGGFNGGGDAGAYTSSTYGMGSGGGATHIASAPGLLSTLSGNQSAVKMVAGAGGGSGSNNGPTNLINKGANAGGLIGSNGLSGTYGGFGGTQTAGGNNSSVPLYSGTMAEGGSFGKGGSANLAPSGYAAYPSNTGGGGGAGWYGGAAALWEGGGGGSGYVGSAAGGITIAFGQPGFVPNPVNTGHGYIILTELCNIGFNPSKNPMCFGEAITLTTSAVSNVVWGHTSSTATLLTVSPTSNTSYSLAGQAVSGCSTSVVITITVNPLPVLSAVVIPSVLCIGNAATVIASGANTYTWATGSVVAPTTTVNPVVTSNFNYSGTNQYGCVTSTQVAVTVNTNTLGITPNSAVCAGNSIVLTANNAVTYTWSTGNNFQSTPVTPVTNTTYMASGTDIHNCVISNQVNITVEQKPNVTASAGKSTICKGESTTLNASGANTYTWSGSLGGGAQVTVNPPVDVVYSYTVTGTSANGCENTAVVAVTVSKCTGLSKTGGDVFNSRIYPNPTSGEVTVELNNGLINSIEVTDLTGRVIMNVDTKEEVVNLNLNKLSNGVYYFKIKSTEHVEIIKVVKSN